MKHLTFIFKCIYFETERAREQVGEVQREGGRERESQAGFAVSVRSLPQLELMGMELRPRDHHVSCDLKLDAQLTERHSCPYNGALDTGSRLDLMVLRLSPRSGFVLSVGSARDSLSLPPFLCPSATHALSLSSKTIK